MEKDSISYQQDIEAELRKRENWDLSSIATSFRHFTKDIVLIDNLSFIHNRNHQKQERIDRKKQETNKQQNDGEHVVETTHKQNQIEIKLNAEHNIRINTDNNELKKDKHSKCMTRFTKRDKWQMVTIVLIFVGSFFVIALFFMPLWINTLQEKQHQDINDQHDNSISNTFNIDDILHIHTTSISPSENIETSSPSISPTTLLPTMTPSVSPSYAPSLRPSYRPIFNPTKSPSYRSSLKTTNYPTNAPTTAQPTSVSTSVIETLFPTTTNSSDSTMGDYLCDVFFFIC